VELALLEREKKIFQIFFSNFFFLEHISAHQVSVSCPLKTVKVNER
jgi:hypothetical protein